ncbi:MAG: D-aminoacylase [Bacillota bacterium]
MFDIIIRGGQIIDGTGRDRYRADVGVTGDAVTGIGDLSGAEANETIDASDLIVAPGFIDTHSHADVVAWASPAYDSKVLQGVTTEHIGLCGISLAPCSDQYMDLLQRYIDAITGEEDIEWNWRSFSELLDVIDEKSMPINLLPSVGHGTVRTAVMGFEDRPPSAEELEQMKDLVREAMEAGAFALTSGLVYPPGSYSDGEEMRQLCRVVSEFGGMYSTHMRSESHQLLESVEESIRAAEGSGVTLLLSHFKAMGQSNWGKVEEALALVDRARGRGVRVWLDQYPYTANSTLLSALIPPWAHAGGVPALLERLNDPAERSRIIETIETVDDGSWENFVLDAGGWDGALVAWVPEDPSVENVTLADLARKLGKTPGDALADLLVDNRASGMVITLTMCDEDVRTVMRHPAQVVGSDALPHRGKPHPRSYGTFPRVLGKYCREEGVFTLEEAVRKMTGQSAEILGLKDRGILARGKRADITVFDPRTVRDGATYEEPQRKPAGIPWVLVNGKCVVRDGQFTNESAGRLIRRPEQPTRGGGEGDYRR